MSITYKTLEVFLEKCEGSLGQIEAKEEELLGAIEELKQQRNNLRDQRLIVNGQVITLKDLMSSDNHHVELPYAKDGIEEMFDKRLEAHKNMTPGEVYKKRQDSAYTKESMLAAEMVDETNREDAGEALEESDTEGDS